MNRLILLLLLLAGCAGTSFTWEQVKRLKTGMTKNEVLAVMGEPYMKMKTTEHDKWIWSHSQTFGETKAVSILFVNDTVSQVPPTP